MRCRMMFVETVPGGAVVDVLGDGTMTTLEACIPFCRWGFAAALTLGRWAAAGAELDLELYEGRGAHRARISDDERRILFDLRAPATVSRHTGATAEAGSGESSPLETAGS